MLDFSVYLVYRVWTALVSWLPLRMLFHTGAALGLIHWLLLPGYRRLAERNLAIAFRDAKSPAELRRLARKHFQRLGANLLCSVKLGTMPVEEVVKCVTLENAEFMHEQLRAGRGVALAISHLGNWELFAQVFTTYFDYAPISTVFQPLRNRYIDADVRRNRARAGVQLFDRREGFQKPIELLRSGGVVGILSDQHAGDQGLWTPFFGRLASTTPLPGLLAKRTGAAVITSVAYTESPGRWRLTFNAPLNAPNDSVDRITGKTNAEGAEQIRRAPEDWFWVHNRWKTPKPNFLLSRYKRGVYLPEGAALQPFRILIRAPNWLGDSVISSAAVRAIKRGRPDAHVTIAAPAKLAPVWKLISEVDEVLPLPAKSLWGSTSLLRRQPRFDVSILFPNSLRSALEVWLAGIPRRVGFRGHHRSWLLNQVVPDRITRGPIEHQVHHYLHLADSLGADKADAQERVPPDGRALARPYLGLCPGAEYGPAKRWLPERFAEVAAAVTRQRNVQWVLFGTAADGEAGRKIADSLEDNCVNRIGQTTLDDLIRELRECQLLLTNDTGTMHLATLLNVPVVAVFGSTEHRLTGPLGNGHVVIRHHVECSPCFLRECPIDFRCMHAVTAEEVAAAVLQMLR
ncbi:MAG TPA: lipopolysaccharide heptosyltransferase II [Chthoniobacterales bacterium]|nr:lipopolysaccharide heptosyltransferase II [Chthoniobacterales bacterium]